MKSRSELTQIQVGMLDSLSELGGSSTPHDLAEAMGAQAEHILKIFHGLPPGWARMSIYGGQSEGDGSLALTFAARRALK